MELKISVEGNIGSGKSSMLKMLKENFKMIKLNDKNSNKCDLHLNVYPEPVDLWCNVNSANMLDLMYKDPIRWAYTFCSYCMLTVKENHEKLNKVSNAINLNLMERSLYSSRYVFVENFITSQIFRPFEFELYKKWFDWITKAHDCKLDIIIYLKTNPETCIARFKKRARPEEINRLSSDYVTNLHNFHELWLNSSSTDYYRPQNVIVINADQSADKVYEEIERKLLEILKSLIK